MYMYIHLERSLSIIRGIFFTSMRWSATADIYNTNVLKTMLLSRSRVAQNEAVILFMGQIKGRIVIACNDEANWSLHNRRATARRPRLCSQQRSRKNIRMTRALLVRMQIWLRTMRSFAKCSVNANASHLYKELYRASYVIVIFGCDASYIHISVIIWLSFSSNLKRKKKRWMKSPIKILLFTSLFTCEKSRAHIYIFGGEKKFTACGIQVGALGTDSTEGGRRSMNFWMKSTSP